MSQNRIKRALALLKDALRWSVAHNRVRRAKRIRAARRDLMPVEQHVAPKPAPKPSLDHKLFIPHAIRLPIPQTKSDPNIRVAGAVFHIAVTNADSLHGLFENDGGIESTGYIRFDGTLEQYRPLNVECDAQFDGNSWFEGSVRWGFASFESAGGVPDGGGEWTDKQLLRIKQIIRFIHDQHGVPLQLTNAWNGRGFGYHRLFPQWNHNGHVCPGDARVAQFRHVIVPWMRAGAPL